MNTLVHKAILLGDNNVGKTSLIVYHEYGVTSDSPTSYHEGLCTFKYTVPGYKPYPPPEPIYYPGSHKPLPPDERVACQYWDAGRHTSFQSLHEVWGWCYYCIRSHKHYKCISLTV